MPEDIAGAPEPVPGSLLKHYGESLAVYCGKGHLVLQDGKRAACNFEAGQTCRGDVLLFCYFSTPVHPFQNLVVSEFIGRTDDGVDVSASGKMEDKTYLPPLPEGRVGQWSCFMCKELRVARTHQQAVTHCCFGVTNLELATCCREAPHRRFLPLCLQTTIGPVPVRVVPVKDYDDRFMRLSTLKTVDVTCEIEVPITGTLNVEGVMELADTLCYIFSVAQGTKVNWIYRKDCDAAFAMVGFTHHHRTTRPYNVLSLIDQDVVHQNEFREFVETAYPCFVKHDSAWQLKRGTIDAYLEGKAEGDFLETRGVKLAAAAEALKAMYLQTAPDEMTEFHLSKDVFKNAIPWMVDTLHQAMIANGVEESVAEKMCTPDTLLNLNRRSFSQLLKDVCTKFDYTPTSRERSLFIASRNALIHNGRFYCKLPPEGRPGGPVEEYFFMVNFLDRLYLHLLGWNGRPYIDWRMPDGPRRVEGRSA